MLLLYLWYSQEYSASEITNDIALLKLKDSDKFIFPNDYMRPVRLPDANFDPYDRKQTHSCYASGFGATGATAGACSSCDVGVKSVVSVFRQKWQHGVARAEAAAGATSDSDD